MAEQNEIDQILNQWVQGQLSDEQVSEIIGKEDMLKYQQILFEVDSWVPSKEETVFDPKEVMNRPKANEGKVVSMFGWKRMAVAASIVLVLAVSFLYLGKREKTYYTSFGETKRVELPDGSFATLSSHSQIAWDSKDWDTGYRKVRLKGRGFFEVKSGETFSVVSEQGQVEVLGTQFDVADYKDGFLVRCFEGKVRATEKLGSSQLVTAGEAVLFHEGDWEKKEALTNAKPSWLEAKPKYENIPLGLLIEEIESIYGVKVVTKDVNLNRRFTGSIPTDDLKLALEIVFGTLDIKYEIKEQKVILTK
ncbi:FecR family protein [Reichenbachiella ulvae]|uniref:FecR domain-containing protein n=1 Tax=Reichenbachiella ulvae TaxID=2980104 RepID=A0ABT3CX52_9BACT|nr:FecR domain-containing protein [Reichenbachiella ulvae]MCV9388285.1 FecR domain-containing protein [Reichenbachiella ulvae]